VLTTGLRILITAQIIALLAGLTAPYPAEANGDCVILLHGLARTSASMDFLQSALEQEGYSVANIDYPSRKHNIAKLAEMAIDAGLDACMGAKIHFVTHSLGGILVRYYLEIKKIHNLGRVVMLAPPNQGSQVVDNWRCVPGYSFLNGPAGLELGTDSSSVPLALGPVDYELGVIAGTKSVNLILSLSLPNPNDGKISVQNTKVAGMKDFITVPHSHPFIMNSDLVAEQTINFLREGSFSH
jgi:pimeloyl-ACP methyl ester carboxylesterase